MAEYALILGLIAIFVIAASCSSAAKIDDLFQATGSSVTNPGLAAPSVHAGRPRSPIAAGRRSCGPRGRVAVRRATSSASRPSPHDLNPRSSED